jgi:hypothetical protein
MNSLSFSLAFTNFRVAADTLDAAKNKLFNNKNQVYQIKGILLAWAERI